jgi:hypothetical protein
VDVVLELLDHTMSMVERVLQSFRFELAVARRGFGRRWRRGALRSDGIPFLNYIIRGILIRRSSLGFPHPVGHMFGKLLVLGRELVDFTLQCVSFGLAGTDVAPEI